MCLVVGRRSSLGVAGAWGDEPPETRLVAIGARAAVDPASLRRAFEVCIAGPAATSPLKRLAARLPALGAG